MERRINLLKGGDTYRRHSTMREKTEEGNNAPEVAGAGKNLEKASKEASITEAHRTIWWAFHLHANLRRTISNLSDLLI